jgi:hypothetical protein
MASLLLSAIEAVGTPGMDTKSLSSTSSTPAQEASDTLDAHQLPSSMRLPVELHIMIFDARCAAIFSRLCPFRRHIARRLQEQVLLDLRCGDDMGAYLQESHLHDRNIRKEARRCMDYYELAIIKDMYDQATSLSQVSTLALERVLIAHQRWLQNIPMDFRTFRHFCANPDDSIYAAVKDELVIELFSQDDFLVPPSELDDTTKVHHPLTQRHRVDINFRDQRWLHSPSHLIVDMCLFSGMLDLWITELTKLPNFVKKLTVLFKPPFSDPTLVHQPRSIIRMVDRERLKNTLAGAVGEADIVGTAGDVIRLRGVVPARD